MLCEEDAPIMPLFAVTNLFMVRPTIRHLDINPLGFIYFKKARIAP